MPKAGKEKPPAVIVDGIDTSPFTREKLEQFTIKKKDELDREREERNYFQLERDKIRVFWEITLKELEEAKAVLKNIERASEVTQEENQEILVFEKQKTKFLKYDQLGDLAALRAENVVALKVAKEEHEEQELILFNEKRETKESMAAKLQVEAEDLKRTKEKHQDQFVKTKAMYEEEKIEIENKTDRKLIETKIELEVRHRTELAEVEERKNKHVDMLIEQHEKTFSELKNYYNDITLNNLGLIASIKCQIEMMTADIKRANRIYRDAVAEAKRLQEPLRLALLDNKELKRQMANYDRDKASLKAKLMMQAKLDKKNKQLQHEYQNLEIRFEKTRIERDGIKARFSSAVQNVKEKLSTQSDELEGKLNSMQGPDLRPREIQEIFRLKDLQVDELCFEAARLRKAHDDLLATYEAKLAKFGVPLDERGFQPLKPVVVAGLSPIIGQGPANLVTKNQ